MNAQDARLLTLEPKMKMVFVCPGYEYWEGDILYSFIRSFHFEKMINDIMRDPTLLCIWVDPNENRIVSTKI